ncbi:MAG: hypothetical protein AAGH79_12650, partial [Bacteroidota bacterium]
MKNLNVFLWEWKHFIRSPFKILAVLLFVVASLYGLHNGAHLYHKQQAEIERITTKAEEDRQKIMEDHYQLGNLKDEDRPWIDYGVPFWAIWWSYPHHFKTPSPAMVYSIGQSEQFGFYKRITFWASPYDADLAEEIANPERLQSGSLDFSFALLFLLPLVLLVLLYNLKSTEAEQGFLPLIEVQMPAKNTWILLRMGFYLLVLLGVSFALLIYGARLTNVWEKASPAFGQLFLQILLYLSFWTALYYFILINGQTIVGNTLKMSGIYLLFAFIIPAAVHQFLSINQPTNLMIDFIDVREQQEDLYSAPDSVFQAQLNALFPEIMDSPVYGDSTKAAGVRSRSTAALVNEFKKASIQRIEAESQ